MAPYAKSKYMKLAKGYRGKSHSCWTLVQNRVDRALNRMQKGRKEWRRTVRKEWNVVLGSAARETGLGYAKFWAAARRSNISLNKKVLAGMARDEPYSFRAIVEDVMLQGKLAEQRIAQTKKDYFEAVGKGDLVFGVVQPIDPTKLKQKFKEIEFDEASLPEQIKGKIIYDDERPDEGKFDNIFRL